MLVTRCSMLDARCWRGSCERRGASDELNWLDARNSLLETRCSSLGVRGRLAVAADRRRGGIGGGCELLLLAPSSEAFLAAGLARPSGGRSLAGYGLESIRQWRANLSPFWRFRIGALLTNQFCEESRGFARRAYAIQHWRYASGTGWVTSWDRAEFRWARRVRALPCLAALYQLSLSATIKTC